MKTSKVKSVTANGTYKSNYGLLYKFEYEMEDGTVLSANHKSVDNFFKEGTTVDYEIKGTKDGFSWGSVVISEQHNSFKKDDDYQKGMIIGHAVSNAVNMLCAGVEFEHVPNDISNDNKIYFYAQRIIKIAEKLKAE